MASASEAAAETATKIQCHYELLGVEQDADAGTIKKAHRKLALKHHPDKNHGDDQAAEKFRLVQQAYEVLSDPQERKWYDDHRDAILAGWSTMNASNEDASASMLFNMVPYMHPGCYSGYDNDDKGGFYQVYQQVFEHIVACERKQSDVSIELPTTFGTADSDFDTVVRDFYVSWESFSSALNFAWEDQYNAHEDAPNRRVRRLMEDDNRKARKAAKKEYNNDILQLVAFVKRRDPRVKAKQVERERQKKEYEARQKVEQAERKKEQQKAREEWKQQAQREMEMAEEEDRLAGRIRLADLEDDYDYGGNGSKKKKGKKKNKNKQQYVPPTSSEEEVTAAEAGPTNVIAHDDPEREEIVAESLASEATENDATDDPDAIGDDEAENDVAVDVDIDVDDDDEVAFSGDDADEEEEESESSQEPDIWRCECCRKDFKSEGQMENHMKSKKHKEAFKKYEAKLKKKEDIELMADMMDDLQV